MIISEDVYLEHYGVLGMQWGVRKDREQLRRERRAKNAQKYLNKADLLQTRINSLGTPEGYSIRAQNKRIKIMELEDKRDQAVRDAEAKSKGKLSENQRKLVTGAVVVGGILAAYGAYTMVQSGEATRLITKGKDFFKGKDDPGWKFDRSLADKKDVDTLVKDVVDKVNPDYGMPGTKMNCRRATFAYEMRRRGYDVTATKTSDGRGQTPVGVYNALSKEKDIVPSTPGAMIRKVVSENVQKKKGKIDTTPFQDTLIKVKDSPWGDVHVEPNGIFKQLAKYPDGSRGELGMRWLPGGGHSMAWEVVDGKPVIFDTQNGQVYKSGSSAFKTLQRNMSEAGITRLDNKALNTNFLMRWVKNA